ncbi:kinesin-like protein KIF15 [Lethenteron reissneri]|uniref:kinesin-like protein KIF15 n=1 Tax=Lethenteron reissneri TaxID=7753 RepID=UPI002AB78D17|nr:kinesin-like protein KIF15 [Lethenteron reissneri]
MPAVYKGEVPGSCNLNQSSCSDGDAIRVCVRVRPPTEGIALNEGESMEHGMCVTVVSPDTVRVLSRPEPRIFTFDYVASISATQEEIFSVVAKNIIESCMNGYNGTIFAYGQTGSGKTFTMLGAMDQVDIFNHNLRGVIPRSLEFIFSLISREKQMAGDAKEFLCKCSFLEIYNEQVFDLLDPASTSLFIRENIQKGVFVEGVMEMSLSSAAEAYQVLSLGWRNRRVASTSMNRESSRSHAVFTLTIQSKEKRNGMVNIRSSQLNLVDLAGSERQRDTQSDGMRLKEAGSINRSLSSLGNVINALAEMAHGKGRFVPYRDSKLTFLLRDSLGGNAKTAVIVNVHPGGRYFGETLSTLQFARRTKLIKNKAVVNEDTRGDLSQLQAEIKRLREQLSLQQEGLSSAPSYNPTPASVGFELPRDSWRQHFLEAMQFRQSSETDMKALQGKIKHLEDLCERKERRLQSNRMIIKFRESLIAQLERTAKGSGVEAEGCIKCRDENIANIKQELALFKEMVEHHPEVSKFAQENHNLRAELKQLRELAAVRAGQELSERIALQLDRAFADAMAQRESAGPADNLQPTSVCTDTVTSAGMERMKVELQKMQNDVASARQELEENKELSRKKQGEMENELQSLRKQNQQLETLIKATQTSKLQEVTLLNRVHAEAIKNLTTPVRMALTRRLDNVSRTSVDGSPALMQRAEVTDDFIFNEVEPEQVSTQAYEVIADELRTMQEQSTRLQQQLIEEETRVLGLQQNLDKVDLQRAQHEQLLLNERNIWAQREKSFSDSVALMERKMQETESTNSVLQSEVHDLRVVLKSADRDLAEARKEVAEIRRWRDGEAARLANQLLDLQLQTDVARREQQSAQEEKIALQDSLETLQEELRFNEYSIAELRDTLRQERERTTQLDSDAAKLMKTLECQAEKSKSLSLQLEDKESTQKELLKVIDDNFLLKQQHSELLSQMEQQKLELHKAEETLRASTAQVEDLQRSNKAYQESTDQLIIRVQEERSASNGHAQRVAELENELCELKATLLRVETSHVQSVEAEAKLKQSLLELNGCMEMKSTAYEVTLEMLRDDQESVKNEMRSLTANFETQSCLLGSVQQEADDARKNVENLQAQLLHKEAELARLQAELEEKLQSVYHPSDQSSPVPPASDSQLTPCWRKTMSAGCPVQSPELEELHSRQAMLSALVQDLQASHLEGVAEIALLKEQLAEKESLRETLDLKEGECRLLASQLDEMRREYDASEEKLNSTLKLLSQQAAASRKEESTVAQLENQVMERTRYLQAEIDQLNEQLVLMEDTQLELLRVHAAEEQLFREKEDIRSSLEQMQEEKDRLVQEVQQLKKHNEELAVENGKISGHQNLQQKIQYMVKLKKDLTKLTEDMSKLQVENTMLREQLLKHGTYREVRNGGRSMSPS